MNKNNTYPKHLYEFTLFPDGKLIPFTDSGNREVANPDVEEGLTEMCKKLKQQFPNYCWYIA